ncbi:MAG: NADH-quinone oxidoreductase subunit C [Alphaproteobacteria bacterium]
MKKKHRRLQIENNLENLAAYIEASLQDSIKNVVIKNGILNIYAQPRLLPRVLSFLRDDANCRFSSLTNISGIDYPEKEERFEVLYHILSHELNQRIIVRITNDGLKLVKSVSQVYDSAVWYEQEVWDMFGICFAEHPDLRRLYNDFGFKGYPLRKDFPLNGEFEKKFDDNRKIIRLFPKENEQTTCSAFGACCQIKG